jgi:hypothetical protein
MFWHGIQTVYALRVIVSIKTIPKKRFLLQNDCYGYGKKSIHTPCYNAHIKSREEQPHARFKSVYPHPAGSMRAINFSNG